MDQSNRESIRALSHLYSIVEAGERGYAVAAANVNNRGLKLLFKTYARQRSDFKRDLKNEIQRMSESFGPRSSFPAMIHRGRINIFAALTIGEQDRESVVIREVVVGERAALKAYESVLAKPLPAGIKDIVENQYQAVQSVVDEVRRMQGKDGKKLVVRLYDSEADAGRAIRALKRAHMDSASMEKVSMEQAAESYEAGRQSTLFETILSGAVGGGMWGAVSGDLAGFGVLHLPGLGLEHASVLTQEQVWAGVALGAIAAGSFVGAMLGTFIGWGIHGGDAYLYDQSLQHGQILLKLQADTEQAAQAWQIMARINREAQGCSEHAIA